MSGRGDARIFPAPVYLRAWGSAVGRKEAEGPLGACFDETGSDNRFGCRTWEQAETEMISRACRAALRRGALPPEEIELALGGDLLNQCVASSFAMRALGRPYFGLYGACSTMAEGLILGAALAAGGFAETVLALASSHFCSAERQYRYPLEYGGQRPPSAQWTATACGAVILSRTAGPVRVTGALPGRIYDPGVTDAANMGAAMAQSAYETLRTWFGERGRGPEAYDLILTGDLAAVGSAAVRTLFSRDGVELGERYQDCGCLLFSPEQDAHAGASGCGCSAAVLCGAVLPRLARGELRRVLFCGTGALMSPVTSNQGESIPGICHLVELEGGEA